MDIWEKFRVDSNPGPQDHQSNTLTTRLRPMENLWYLCGDLLMYTVASPDPDPDPNSRGGGQLPNPKSAILCQRVQRGERR